MIVDTSALVAIILSEVGHQQFVDRILGERGVKISAGSRIELQTVAVRKRIPDALVRVEQILGQLAITTVPIDSAHAQLAGEGFVRFGQGSGEVSALNFGDCFAYALAKATGEPLLFKGDDFTKTDVIAA